MWGGAITSLQLQQTISRFRKLDELPEVPSENLAVLEVGQTRHLRISRQKEIASNLAFLSATSDKGLKVMAVCVEKHCNGEGITIRIASNTGDLSAVIREFITLAKIFKASCAVRSISRPSFEMLLIYLSENSKAEDTDALFRQVVALDLYRILSRLRSRHRGTWKTGGRPALITQLHAAINDKSVKARSGLTKSSLKAGRDRARALHSLFTKLEGMSDLHAETSEAHEVVGEIIKQAHEFPLVTLSAALQSSMLEPSLKQYLPEALASWAAITLLRSSLFVLQGTGRAACFRTFKWSPSRFRCPPLFRNHPGKFSLRYSSSSFMSFIHAISDRDSFALARVLATCATSSSPSTAASTCLEHTAGSTTNGPYRTG